MDMILKTRKILLLSGIPLLLLSFSAVAAMPYGQQPAGYYGQPPAQYYRHPAPVAYPQPQQVNPNYWRGFQQPYYRPAPAYPFNTPYRSVPAQRAPQQIKQPTIAAIRRPATLVKPGVINQGQPRKLEPKKVVPDSKLVFLQKVAPLVRRVNEKVSAERAELINLISRLDRGFDLNGEQTSWLKSRMKKYRVKGDINVAILRQSLLPKIDIIPVELALAQAANESAWGKSRFAREAQNLFGVWTYDESKGIVPKKRAKGKKHLVRKYVSMEASIRHYITLLNSHPAYKALRDIRLEQRTRGQQLDGTAMAGGLIKYSAKGEKYVAIIRSMISSNNLTDFRSA